jgi:hypothetical protein
MTIAVSSLETPTTTSKALERSVPLTIAAFASLGAGAIHAAAIGSHGDFPEVVRVFTATAVFQIGWGALALLSPRRAPISLGVIGNAALFGGWVLAMTQGISFVEGLDENLSPSSADSLAAGFAAVAVLAGTWAILRPAPVIRYAGVTIAFAGLATIALGVMGMDAAAAPDHHGGAAGPDHHGTAAGTGEDSESDHHATEDIDDHEAAVARPYDPALPIDLGGVEGVTPEQQARAENLISATLLALPRYADPAVAEAAGFQSIHDGVTGYEHFINNEYRADGEVLNPNRPESLVYQLNRYGERQLVAAMFMAEPGTTLDTVPELGGPLTQWHIHDNLCFTPGDSPRVAGLTDAAGNCPAPLVKPEAVPMIHVWITPHECGPFAALEGIAGGQIPEGEARLCDTAHGGH